MDYEPVLSQLNLAVRDMGATAAFYRRLGLPIEANEDTEHVACTLPNGMIIEWDQTDFVTVWDSSSTGETGGTTVLCFSLPSRDAVNDVYGDLIAGGYHGRQQPYDAFWGARYAIVADPDGNPVGLMSPIDPDFKYWPPETPPSGP